MSTSVKEIAQLCMDAFYQEFKPTDGFWRLEQFILLCVAVDNKLKQDEYKEQKILNFRNRIINAFITLNTDNYETVIVDVKDNKAKLPNPIMNFSGDEGTIGVSVVEPIGKCSSSFIRTTINEKWQLCKITDTVFWYPLGEEIEFMNLDKVCKVDKVRVIYIPAISENSRISEGRSFQIITTVSQFMKAVKEGNIVDMSSDGNPNVIPQTEINKYLLKAIGK